jgi:prephenate dehydratase
MKIAYLGPEGTYTQVAAEKLVADLELAMGIHPDSSVERITEIRSKQSALGKCSQYLAARFPDASRVYAAFEAAGLAVRP